MISMILGQIVLKNPPSVIVNVNGVGYELFVPMTVVYELGEIGEEVKLFTHFSVREDAQTLYGFLDTTTRDVFRILIKVNGVGPKLALAVLSGMDSFSLYNCINENDVPKLVKLPGVGKKTAERIIVETSDKLKKLFEQSYEHIALVAKGGLISSMSASFQAREEAESALVALGYKQGDAKKIINSIADDSMDSEQIIRQALKQMIG